MGLYAFMLAGSNFLAPVFAGFINDGQGEHASDPKEMFLSLTLRQVGNGLCTGVLYS